MLKYYNWKNIEIIKIQQEEWKKVIDVQMHFNQLIIQFRTAILTIFITLLWWILWYIWIIYKDRNIVNINNVGFNIKIIFLLPLIFLLIWFVIDYFYYSKLLFWSIEAASKFDNDENFKKLGLYWLTREISKKTSWFTFSFVMIILYLFPMIIYFIFCYIILIINA